jgi:outer membrane immunogenic protein
MKTIFVAGTALVVLSASAFAADLPARVSAPSPVAPPVFTWGGFYVGGNIGYSLSERGHGHYCLDFLGVRNGDSCQVLPAGETGLTAPRGVLGGVQAGYNLQFDALVIGVEGDLQIASIGGNRTVNGPFGFASGPDLATPPGVAISKQTFDNFGTLRMRLGYAVSDRALVYVTGGLIGGHVKVSSTFTAPNVGVVFSGVNSSTKAGWAAGGGVEYFLSQRWSTKIEAVYYDLGSSTTLGLGSGNPYQHNYSFVTRGVLAKFGINYKL